MRIRNADVARQPEGPGVREAEIEITDEMLAAGSAAAADYDSRFEPFGNLPVAVYEAMERVRRIAQHR